jgi:hypothetical protein
LTSSGNIKVALATDGTPKLFYSVSGNVPDKVKGSIKADGLNSIYIGNERYEPIYISADEAEVMKKENIFSKDGDLIKGFFGQNVIVAGILPKTNSPLDNFYFLSN